MAVFLFYFLFLDSNLFSMEIVLRVLLLLICGHNKTNKILSFDMRKSNIWRKFKYDPNKYHIDTLTYWRIGNLTHWHISTLTMKLLASHFFFWYTFNNRKSSETKICVFLNWNIIIREKPMYMTSIILYTKIISDNTYFVSKTNFLTKRKSLT